VSWWTLRGAYRAPQTRSWTGEREGEEGWEKGVEDGKEHGGRGWEERGLEKKGVPHLQLLDPPVNLC